MRTVDGVPRDLLPAGHAVRQRSDGHQAVDSHLAVVLAPHEVVDDRDVEATGRKVQGGGPAEVAIASENQNLHPHPFVCSGTRFPKTAGALSGHIMGQNPESKLWNGCHQAWHTLHWGNTVVNEVTTRQRFIARPEPKSALEDVRASRRAPAAVPVRRARPTGRGAGPRPGQSAVQWRPGWAPRCRRGSSAPGLGSPRCRAARG